MQRDHTLQATGNQQSPVTENADALDLEIVRVAGHDDGVMEPGDAGNDGVTQVARTGSAQPSSGRSRPTSSIGVGRDVFERIHERGDPVDGGVVAA
jgi:hypothetical protein